MEPRSATDALAAKSSNQGEEKARRCAGDRETDPEAGEEFQVQQSRDEYAQQGAADADDDIGKERNLTLAEIFGEASRKDPQIECAEDRSEIHEFAPAPQKKRQGR